MGRRLTERQQELRDAYAALTTAKNHRQAALRAVRTAEAALAALLACDRCGQPAYPSAAAEWLCADCAAVRRRQQRLELLAQHGYGPDGRRLPAAERPAA